MLGSFVSLAEAVGQKLGSMIVKQGVETPKQRPVSTSGDSFDLAASVRKLVEPVQNLFTPKSGVQILEGAVSSVGGSVIDALGRNASSAIDKLFGNSNKMPSAEARQETNIVRAEDPFGAQTQTLGEAFKLFSQIQQGNAGLNTPSQTIPQNNNTGLLIMGFVGLAAVFLLTRKGN